jgi:hypothetical protein
MRADSQVALRAVGTPAKAMLKVLAGYRRALLEHCDVARYPVLVARGGTRGPAQRNATNLAQARVRVHRHGVPRTEDEVYC